MTTLMQEVLVNRIALVLAAGFAAVSICASAADLTDHDRSELRQRAEAFHAERARNPEYQPGEGRLNRQPDATPARSARASKRHAVAKTGETRRHKAARKIRNIPGAFVHGK
jgi:hypothetical protein